MKIKFVYISPALLKTRRGLSRLCYVPQRYIPDVAPLTLRCVPVNHVFSPMLAGVSTASPIQCGNSRRRYGCGRGWPWCHTGTHRSWKAGQCELYFTTVSPVGLTMERRIMSEELRWCPECFRNRGGVGFLPMSPGCCWFCLNKTTVFILR